MRIRSLTTQLMERLRDVVHLLLAATLAATLTACGDSNDDNGDSNLTGTSETGEVVIALTDVEGDFLTYTVNVQALTLTKADGSVVTTLTEPTTVDFAQYGELTEFLTAATVPAGAYTSATMTLDFEGADIQVENAAGDAVPVNNIQDAQGNALGTLEVSVQLQGNNALFVDPEVPVHLTLDFDLNASNTVEFDTAGTPTVTVEPFLVADLDPQAPKPHRLRGLLESVDVDNSTFQVILRPFFNALDSTPGADLFGTLAVTTTDTTVYEIDGVTQDASTGLEALAATGSLTATVVIGELKSNPRRFEAQQVFAGSSVPGGTLDATQGNVVARSGDQLTLRGATLIRAGGTIGFNDTIQVTVGSATQVTRLINPNDALTIGDISVGQRVTVFGTITQQGDGSLVLDASNGQVRLLATNLRGTVNSASEGGLVVNLQSISGRDISLFDFSGTGTSAEQDADPANYEVDTGVLDFSALASGSPVQVAGFAAAFGAAPPDFNAVTVVDVTMTTARMVVDWEPASTAPFTDTTAAGITLDLANTQRHDVFRGGVVTDLTGLANATVIAPESSGTGVFLIKENGTVLLHTNFENFVADLESRLSPDTGLALRLLTATGGFDEATATLTAQRIAVSLQ